MVIFVQLLPEHQPWTRGWVPLRIRGAQPWPLGALCLAGETHLTSMCRQGGLGEYCSWGGCACRGPKLGPLLDSAGQSSGSPGASGKDSQETRQWRREAKGSFEGG